MRWFGARRNEPAAGRLPAPHEESGFRLTYQPIFRLYTPTLAGAEVLVRWERGYQNRLPASAFVHEYDRARRLSEVGEWVINRAAIAGQAWREQGLNPPRLFVNLGYAEVMEPTLGTVIQRALDGSGLSGDLLGFEMQAESIVPWMRHARTLNALGIRVAVEDAGSTDTSWLRHAAAAGIETTKIDMTRATQSRISAELLSAVDAAHHANVEVCGTRIETPAQADSLSLLRCDTAQGFMFAGPLTGDEFTDVLRSVPDWD